MVGVELNQNEVVTKAPPLVKFMHRWTKRQVVDYCAKKRWSCEIHED